MDPRLKLNYYEENDWKETYIEEVRETVFKVWKTDYKIVNEQHDEIEDKLFFHIFKKKRKTSQKDEFTEYLKESVVSHSIDVLM